MNSPTPPLFIDLETARALEGAEAAASAEFCRTAARLYPGKGMHVIECAGGSGQFYGPANLLNAVKGVGLCGTIDQREWDLLEAAYRESGSPVVVDLCPLADAGFVEMLGKRGYAIGSFETVMCRQLEPGRAMPDAALAPDIQISIVGPDLVEEWSRVLGVGFANGGEPLDFGLDIGYVRANLAHSNSLMATVNGVPAGGAAMSITGHVAHMAGAAVLPEFRRRGIQHALSAARLRLAAERGCTLAKLDVHAGSVSYRNAVRAGFQVAYTRPQLVKTW